MRLLIALAFLAFEMYTSAWVFVFLLNCFLGCIECYYFYYFYFFFLLSIFIIYFFFFDMDHWSDTNKWLIDWFIEAKVKTATPLNGVPASVNAWTNERTGRFWVDSGKKITTELFENDGAFIWDAQVDTAITNIDYRESPWKARDNRKSSRSVTLRVICYRASELASATASAVMSTQDEELRCYSTVIKLHYVASRRPARSFEQRASRRDALC